MTETELALFASKNIENIVELKFLRDLYKSGLKQSLVTKTLHGGYFKNAVWLFSTLDKFIETFFQQLS